MLLFTSFFLLLCVTVRKFSPAPPLLFPSLIVKTCSTSPSSSCVLFLLHHFFSAPRDPLLFYSLSSLCHLLQLTPCFLHLLHLLDCLPLSLLHSSFFLAICSLTVSPPLCTHCPSSVTLTIKTGGKVFLLPPLCFTSSLTSFHVSFMLHLLTQSYRPDFTLVFSVLVLQRFTLCSGTFSFWCLCAESWDFLSGVWLNLTSVEVHFVSSCWC